MSSEVAQKDQEIKKLTDQLAWFRQKYFSKSSEKFTKEDPNQRKLDFDGLEILPEEVTAVKEADKQIAEFDNEKHKTRKAYLWMVRSVMDDLVFFHYDKGSRAQKVVVDLLKDFKGAIQTDGYSAYSIYERKKGVLLLSCWAHARRKFHESLQEDKNGAEYALEQIGKLYKVEQSPKLHYNLFERLSRYHLDGRYLPDTNLAENAIRPLAVGRKGYLFCGNHDAAENAAIMYSLLGCCKASDLNPREWLTDVFSKIASYNANYNLDLSDLLPHIWKKSNKCQGFPKDSD